jgi:MFS family permease
MLASHADRFGRKSTLLIGSLLAISTSFIFATQSNFYVLLTAGIIGVISPSGTEIGPFMAIEMSSLTEVTLESDRTSLMAWYQLFGCFASASGALFCGAILDWLQSSSSPFHYSLETSCRVVLGLYGIVQILQAVFFSLLSNKIEVPSHILIARAQKQQDDAAHQSSEHFLGLHKSKYIVLQLSLLFMLDSFAGSFVLQSIISGWFFEVYQTPSTALGSILFYCNLVAGISSLFAAEIAKYIGLMMTMVVTHLPSNILLMLVPVMPTEWTAMLMIGARYSISQMDVPTRNAYVQTVVESDERSAANGVTTVVRSIGASIGPYLSGLLMVQGKPYINYPFYIAGGLKIVYDLLLLFNFALSRSHLEHKPPSSASLSSLTTRQESNIQLVEKK